VSVTFGNTLLIDELGIPDQNGLEVGIALLVVVTTNEELGTLGAAVSNADEIGLGSKFLVFELAFGE
jgi:hypothetical protein